MYPKYAIYYFSVFLNIFIVLPPKPQLLHARIHIKQFEKWLKKQQQNWICCKSGQIEKNQKKTTTKQNKKECPKKP